MLPSVNIIAVLSAALGSVIASGIWYSPVLFARPWGRLSGVDNASPERKRVFPGLMARMCVAAVLTAYVLAVSLTYTTAPTGGLLGHLAVATGIWVGFIGSRLYISYAFDGQSTALVAINAGNELVSILVMAAILWLF